MPSPIPADITPSPSDTPSSTPTAQPSATWSVTPTPFPTAAPCTWPTFHDPLTNGLVIIPRGMWQVFSIQPVGTGSLIALSYPSSEALEWIEVKEPPDIVAKSFTGLSQNCF